MDPYASHYLSTELQTPYYTSPKKRIPSSPPRPSAMQVANLLNPDDSHSHFTTLSLRPARSSLPDLVTSHAYSYASTRKHAYESVSSALSAPELTRHSSSGSDATRSGSETPPTPPLDRPTHSYPAPYSPCGATHTRQDIEAAHTLTHVGTGLYSSSTSAPTTEQTSSSEQTATGRQYPCPLASMFHCEKKFSTSGHARRHSRTHTGERSAVCPECGHRFSRQDNMQQHRRTHRPGRAGRRGSSRKGEDEGE